MRVGAARFPWFTGFLKGVLKNVVVFLMVFDGNNVVDKCIFAVVNCSHFGVEKHATLCRFIFGLTNFGRSSGQRCERDPRIKAL
jgi:hypothetical protein